MNIIYYWFIKFCSYMPKRTGTAFRWSKKEQERRSGAFRLETNPDATKDDDNDQRGRTTLFSHKQWGLRRKCIFWVLHFTAKSLSELTYLNYSSFGFHWRCWHICGRVYVAVRCPSVCLSQPSTAAIAYCGHGEQPGAGDIDRGVEGSCAKHLTKEFYTVVMLLTYYY